MLRARLLLVLVVVAGCARNDGDAHVGLRISASPPVQGVRTLRVSVTQRGAGGELLRASPTPLLYNISADRAALGGTPISLGVRTTWTAAGLTIHVEAWGESAVQALAAGDLGDQSKGQPPFQPERGSITWAELVLGAPPSPADADGGATDSGADDAVVASDAPARAVDAPLFVGPVDAPGFPYVLGVGDAGILDGPCESGARKCVGEVIYACGIDFRNGPPPPPPSTPPMAWIPRSDCAKAGSTCSDGKCVGACTGGAKLCLGYEPEAIEQTCMDGSWRLRTCPHQCAIDGFACAVCDYPERRCSNGAVQLCGLNGQWSAGDQCTMGCTGGYCNGPCQPETRRCNGRIRQLCGPEGTWASIETCPNGCWMDFCTGSCVAGSIKCDGTALQECTDRGDWTTKAICPNSCSADGCR
jgi:hypothetical protein